MTKYRTHSINRRSAVSLLHARRYAESIGIMFEMAVTVSWYQTDISPRETTAVSKALRRAIKRQLSYRGLVDRFTYLEVQEAPQGNCHTHWMINVKLQHAKIVYEIIQKWLLKRGYDVDPSTVKVSPIDTSGSFLKYILKGIDPYFGQFYYINPVDQGLVFGQRVSTSRHIGKTARIKAGWVRKRRPNAKWQVPAIS